MHTNIFNLFPLQPGLPVHPQFPYVHTLLDTQLWEWHCIWRLAKNCAHITTHYRYNAVLTTDEGRHHRRRRRRQQRRSNAFISGDMTANFAYIP